MVKRQVESWLNNGRMGVSGVVLLLSRRCKASRAISFFTNHWWQHWAAKRHDAELSSSLEFQFYSVWVFLLFYLESVLFFLCPVGVSSFVFSPTVCDCPALVQLQSFVRYTRATPQCTSCVFWFQMTWSQIACSLFATLICCQSSCNLHWHPPFFPASKHGHLNYQMLHCTIWAVE